MKKLLSIIIFVVSLFPLKAQSEVNIVPQPQEIININEQFLIRNQNVKLITSFKEHIQINHAISELKETAQKFQNAFLEEKSESAKTIFLVITSESKEFQNLVNDYGIYIPDSLGEEGYRLVVKSNSIIIAALHQKGLFYGIQTLKQIIRGASGSDYLSGIDISDWPLYKYRAISDDISRGPLPTLDYMKYQIRRLSEMKVNTIIHYVEHVVKTKSHPEFAPDDGSLTIEEWKEISDYALEYNITVIGGFQSFGHFNNILNTPEYAHLGESGSLISPVLPESYEFLEDIYNEMIPAFHSDIFNVNCDETFDLGKEQSKKMVDSIGYDGVYYQHMMKLYDIVKKNGKRMIMWGDILLQYPDLLKKMPKDVIIGTWDYDARTTFKKFIDPFSQAGFEFWVVPGVLNSRRIYPDYVKAFKNIEVFVREGYEAGASGVLNCFWDDGSTGLFSNDWYGAAFGAEKSWNPYSNKEDFDKRYAVGSLGAKNTNLMKSIQKLNELRLLELTDGMTDKFMFTRLLPKVGEHLKISVAGLNEANEIIKQSENLLNNTKLQLYDEDEEYLQFIIDLYKTLINERFELLNAAKSYSKAEEIINTNPSEARELIVNSLKNITNIIQAQDNVKTEFEYLWLKENHIYALDWITKKYDSKIEEFENVKELLIYSLRNYDSSKPIITTENVRLSISKLPGKYFTEWMMTNPITNYERSSNSTIDYLEDMGGVQNAIPKVTQVFYYDSVKYRWRRVVSDYPDILPLDGIFSNKNSQGIVYSFANISSNYETEVSALIGYDEGIEIYNNGQLIYKNSKDDNFKLDEIEFMLPLKKGKNNLMIKSIQTEGKWKFSFRLPKSEVRNSKNRYRIIN